MTTSRRQFIGRMGGIIAVGGLGSASLDGCASPASATPQKDQSRKGSEDSQQSDLEPILQKLTLEEKLGQLLMIPPIEETIRDLHPGSVILRNGNVDDDMETTRRITDDLQRTNSEASSVPLWLHGFVHKRPWACPRDGVIAADNSVAETEQIFFEVGKRWRKMGMHTYPSPTVNVHLFDTGIMLHWAISDDPETTVRYARAITRGLIRAKCGTMAQHFPAHGAAELDSHRGVPVIELDLETLMRDHISPYIASFEEGCTTICTAHLKCPALDPDERNIATTSRAILTDFLRGRLGFKGIAIADEIGMNGFRRQGDQGVNTVRAVMAGCDSICILNKRLAEYVSSALLDSAKDGRLTMERLDEAVLRNLAFKRWLGIL